MERNFPIIDMLYVVTGVVLSKSLGGLNELLDFMTDDHISTSQFPRVCCECRPHILAQHPQLEDVDASGVTPGNVDEWCNQQIDLFGERLPIVPLHKRIDPSNAEEELEYFEKYYKKYAEEHGIFW